MSRTREQDREYWKQRKAWLKEKPAGLNVKTSFCRADIQRPRSPNKVIEIVQGILDGTYTLCP